jgi:hypothetical protein
MIGFSPDLQIPLLILLTIYTIPLSIFFGRFFADTPRLPDIRLIIISCAHFPVVSSTPEKIEPSLAGKEVSIKVEEKQTRRLAACLVLRRQKKKNEARGHHIKGISSLHL